MKKLLLVIIFLSLLISPVFAEEGYRCEENTCLTCTIGEEGCNEGVCTAFICEESDEEAPDAPFITNKEQLESVNDPNFITVKGVGEPNIKVIIFIDGENKYEGNVNSGGVFDLSFNPNLTRDGVHELTAKLVDLNNNESEESETINLVVDLNPPTIKFEDIPDFVNFENVLISGSTEELSRLDVIRDGSIVYTTGADANGNFDLLISLDDGENNFEILATDVVGNEGSTTISINFDSSNSTILEILSSTDNIIEIDIPENVIEIEIYKNNDLIEVISVANESNLNYDINELIEGSSDFKFVGVDIAGNKTTPSIYEYRDSGQIIIIMVGIIIPLGLLAMIVYLIYTGKIDLKFLKKFRSSGQTKMKLEDKQESDTDNDKNIVPDNIRKEF